MTTIVNRKIEQRIMDLAGKGTGYKAFAAAAFLLLEDIADSLRRIADHMDRR